MSLINACIDVVVLPTLGSFVYPSTTINPFLVFQSTSGCNVDSKAGSEIITYLTGYVVITSFSCEGI